MDAKKLAALLAYSAQCRSIFLDIPREDAAEAWRIIAHLQRQMFYKVTGRQRSMWDHAPVLKLYDMLRKGQL